MTTREEFDAIRCPKCGGQDFAVEEIERVTYKVKGWDGGLLLSEEHREPAFNADRIYSCRGCDAPMPGLGLFDALRAVVLHRPGRWPRQALRAGPGDGPQTPGGELMAFGNLALAHYATFQVDEGGEAPGAKASKAFWDRRRQQGYVTRLFRRTVRAGGYRLPVVVLVVKSTDTCRCRHAVIDHGPSGCPDCPSRCRLSPMELRQ